MPENCKAPEAFPQTPFGEFTAPPIVPRDLQFEKIINTFMDFAPAKSETFRRPCI